MSKFWWQLRLFWLYYVLKTAVLLGLAAALLITVVTLFMTGIHTWDMASLKALWLVTSFWFYVAWSLAFLIALVLSFKKLFFKNIAGYQAIMLDCQTKEVLDEVNVANILGLWRKFLFLLIWIFGLISLIMMGVFDFSFGELSGYKIFLAILLFGALLLQPILLSTKNVRIIRV